MVPKSYPRIKEFIAQAEQIAAQTGVQANFEPYVFGEGVQITWLERRRDGRIDLDQFIKQLADLADQYRMGLQLSLDDNDRQIKAAFQAHGFSAVTDATHLGMERRPVSARDRRRQMMGADQDRQQTLDFAPTSESAPPGHKAEHFIKHNKADFKKRYGKRWKHVLYGTAWKQFGESRNFRDYLAIIEAIRL